MPLIPQLVSFWNNGLVTMMNPVFKSRYTKALLMLEREQKSIMSKQYENMSQVPLRFAMLNVVQNREGHSKVFQRLKSWKERGVKSIQSPLSFSDLQLSEVRNEKEYLLMDDI